MRRFAGFCFLSLCSYVREEFSTSSRWAHLSCEHGSTRRGPVRVKRAVHQRPTCTATHCSFTFVAFLLVYLCTPLFASQINLYMLIPVPTWVFGAAWCGGIFLTAATNGQLQVPFISSNPRTLWRDMGGVTAGAVLWLLATRRPHLFRKRFY